MKSRMKIALPIVGFSLFVLSGSFADVISAITATPENIETQSSESQAVTTFSVPQIPSESVTTVEAREPSSSASVSAKVETPTRSIGDSQSAVMPPPVAIETPTVDLNARFALTVPTSVAVDPRAKTYQLPTLRLSGSAPVLVCFRGSGVNFDIGQINVIDEINGRSLQSSGDRTSRFALAGSAENVSTYLATYPIWTYSSEGLAGAHFTVSATGLSVPYLDVDNCNRFQTLRSTFFRPLELELNVSKGSGRLK